MEVTELVGTLPITHQDVLGSLPGGAQRFQYSDRVDHFVKKFDSLKSWIRDAEDMREDFGLLFPFFSGRKRVASEEVESDNLRYLKGVFAWVVRLGMDDNPTILGVSVPKGSATFLVVDVKFKATAEFQNVL